MSRNSSGTYTLPGSVNPVITGTTILSDWANTTLADLANEITNSLDRGGRGGMLAPLRLTNGTAGAPSLSFASDTSTGFYRSAGGEISIVTGGVVRATIDAATFSAFFDAFIGGDLDVAGALSAASLTVGLIDGNITGTASNVTGTVAIVNGGTGATTAAAAKTALTVDTGATGSTVIAKGTTAQRDASPVTGLFRYNVTLGNFEGYVGSAWSPLISAGANNLFTAPQRGTLTTDNDLNFNLLVTNNFQCTLAGAATLTFTNAASSAGQSGFILLQNPTGFAVSAAASTQISSSFLAQISAAGTYLLCYFCDGANIYVVSSEALT